MKRRNIFVISILSLIVLLSILIGTGILKLSFYKYEFSNNTSSTWNNSYSLNRFNILDDKVSFPPIPVIVVYNTKKVGDLTSENPLIIDISEKDLGVLWFPLLNKSDYHFVVNCKNTQEINSEFALGKSKIDGLIIVSGHFKFIGLYSKKTANDIVVDKLLNVIYKEIKKNMKNE